MVSQYPYFTPMASLNGIPNHIGKVAFPYANKSGRGAAGS